MALGLLGPVACSQTIVEGEPGFMLSPLPPDVTSGLTALEVEMRPATRPTGPPPTGQQFQVSPSVQEIQAIVASSSLATWPELAPLATTGLVTALGVSFRSTAPAADGWAPQQSFEFVCATSLAPTDVITVSVKEGLLSRGGVGVPVAQRIAAVNTFRLNVLMTECSSLLFEP